MKCRVEGLFNSKCRYSGLEIPKENECNETKFEDQQLLFVII